MTYHFIFEPDYKRIMTAVIIDARASIPQIRVIKKDKRQHSNEKENKFIQAI